MKQKLFLSLAVLAISMATVCYSVYYQRNSEHSILTIENVEALAQGESLFPVKIVCDNCSPLLQCRVTCTNCWTNHVAMGGYGLSRYVIGVCSCGSTSFYLC